MRDAALMFRVYSGFGVPVTLDQGEHAVFVENHAVVLSEIKARKACSGEIRIVVLVTGKGLNPTLEVCVALA